MKLTAYQKRQLEALAAFRQQKPNLWRVLMFRPVCWVPFLLVGVASLAVYFLVDGPWGMFLIGLTVGAVLRIIAHARFMLKGWPVTEQIVDWARVEDLRRAGSLTAAAEDSVAPGTRP